MIVEGGYLDLQINGGYGHDFAADPGGIWSVGSALLAHGVTQFLPTLVSHGFGQLDRALDVLAGGPPPGWVGAQPLGLHLEGPWLSADRRGAHPAAALLSPIEPVPGPVSAAAGVALVTLAPELDGAPQLISELRRRGVVVSIGHTAADIGTCQAAFTAGATMGTHLFNGMSGLQHRAPGAAAALLLDAHVAVGLIADGHHVAPEMVDLAWRLAADRVVLVSDAVTSFGRTTDPVARLSDGTLAGSVIGLDRCVRNLKSFTGCAWAEAAAAASTAPRRVLGIEARQGDAVVIDDKGDVVRTLLSGDVVFER